MVTIKDLKDLAPEIYRQHLIIEAYPAFYITEKHIKEYLSKLSEVCGMKKLSEPVTHQSPLFGWAGWIHWETSGAHFYSWNKHLFFSVDIYTCKKFSIEAAIEFTKDYFQVREIVYKEL